MITDGETLWATTDHLGTIRDMVDDNGTLRKHTQYDTFGRVTGEAYFDTAGDPISAEPSGILPKPFEVLEYSHEPHG